MKRTRFSEEQIVYALKLAESGTSVANVCRKYGISDATFYIWRKKYGTWGFRTKWMVRVSYIFSVTQFIHIYYHFTFQLD